MLTLNVDSPTVSIDYSRNVTLSFRVDPESCAALKLAYDGFMDKPLILEVRRRTKRRSLDANSYLWVLCGKIAEAINSTKEEVYRSFVKDVGQYQILPFRADVADEIVRMWSDRGLGWHAEIIDDSKIDGYKRAICYFGSSVYDGPQMSILLSEVIQTAESMGIPTLPDKEIKDMKRKWNEKKKQESGVV